MVKMQVMGYLSKVSPKEYIHVPVLLTEVVNSLVTSKKGVYVDATYGRGGHSSQILGQLSAEACVVAIDRDTSAIDSAKLFAIKDPRLMPFHSLYSELEIVLERLGISSVEGILMDLGVSSPQLDDPERGFSFQTEGPLDMRMDQTINLTAHSWLNSASEDEIESILKELGDEKRGRQIAREIVRRRPLSTTVELSNVIVEVKGSKSLSNRRHPATKTFQALRMVVNSELEELSKGLKKAFECLSVGGRLVVVSFHSHEDRIVKSFFKELCGKGLSLPRKMPVQEELVVPKAKLIGGPIRPGQKEINQNPRARSAVMRVVEKIRSIES